jgi:hypothetical protein
MLVPEDESEIFTKVAGFKSKIGDVLDPVSKQIVSEVEKKEIVERIINVLADLDPKTTNENG